LDSNHDRGAGATNVSMRQATVNLFADMGVQPVTLQSGLATATSSTDTSGAAVTISSPTAGSSLQSGTAVTVSGTATDSGGVVGGVEVSTDGATWHPATGRGTWSYTWTPGATGSTVIRARATDDSANTGAPASVTVTVGARSCPCSVWGATAAPSSGPDPDTASTEVGVKFRTDVAGQITGLRFYKQGGNTGTHVGHLWTSTGTQLAAVTFTGESTTGWQQANFATPVSVSPGVTYVASYLAPNGRYSADTSYFTTAGRDAAPLHLLADGADGTNGVYGYFGAPGGFPTSAWMSANYWVDVVLSTSTGVDTTPPTVVSRTPASGATGVATTTTVTAAFSEPIQAGTAGMALADAGGNPVAGNTSYDAANQRATFTPSAGLTPGTGYTATAGGARDPAGNQMASTSWSFTTASATTPPTCPCSVWPAAATPSTASDSDTAAVELGMKFRSDVAGVVTGVRFYKGAGNTGTHIGHLWSSTGTNLATVTFTGESASGWQQANFATPIALTAGTTYIVSYYAPVGRYAADAGFFSTGVDRVPLHALADGVDGSNGVYRYGSGGGFPNSTFDSTNYWVDAVFSAG
jgi:methionine-rich copper-binding protein CopC